MNAIVILSLLLKVAVSIQPIPPPDDQLHIYALPVGQGDCTVIQCPRVGPYDTTSLVTIIDAGSSKFLGMQNQDVVDFLAGTKLNLVVLTHSDNDHVNYMDLILNYYAKKVPVYHSCEWNHYMKYIKNSNTYVDSRQVHYCYNIDNCAKKLNLCPNYQPNPDAANSVTLSIVASANKRCVRAGKKEANNEDSIISKITYAGKSTLITGDFELKAELMEEFLNTARPDLSSHIFRLSHHGAYNDDANQHKFLNAVGASYVFSSSGFKHGHPRCEVYDYYAKLSDSIVVDEHPYTCFNSIGKHKYRYLNRSTKKPIYVTSVYINTLSHTFNSKIYKYHMIVKFDISITGHINVETVEGPHDGDILDDENVHEL